MKEKTYKWLAIILAVITMILLVGVGVLSIHCFFSEADSYSTMDTQKYREWTGHISEEEKSRECSLLIFPENLEHTKESKYFYHCANSKTSIMESFIYLEATYEQEQFEKEKERLSNIYCEFNSDKDKQKKPIVYSEKLFNYPAYIAAYCSNLSYEYALIQEQQCKIVYIHGKLFEFGEMIEADYLPLDKDKSNLYQGNSMDNINIYVLEDPKIKGCYYEYE